MMSPVPADAPAISWHALSPRQERGTLPVLESGALTHVSALLGRVTPAQVL